MPCLKEAKTKNYAKYNTTCRYVNIGILHLKQCNDVQNVVFSFLLLYRAVSGEYRVFSMLAFAKRPEKLKLSSLSS